MDTYGGDNEQPLSLHRYLYCEANPVDGIDFTGHEMSWESYFGYEAEDTINDEYKETHPTDEVTYGDHQYNWSLTRYLKPDIFNMTQLKYLEIKPISSSGIAKGILALGRDYAFYKKSGYSADTEWQPRSCILETADDGPIYVRNVGGIVFYQNVDSLEMELITTAVITAPKELLEYLTSSAELAPALARIYALIGYTAPARALDAVPW